MPQEMNLNSFIVLPILPRSKDVCLNSIQVPPHLHPGLEICVSSPPPPPPPLPWFTPPFHPCGVASHLNPDPYVCVSSSSMWRLTSIQAPKIASQLHISIPTTPSRIQDMCLTSIQVLSHLDPGPNNLLSPPYMYCLNPIQVHIVTSHLPPDSVSTPSRSWYSCVTSIKVTSHLHPGLKMYGTPLSMPCLISNQAIHQGCVSPQPMSWYLHLTTIQVTYHLHQVPEICISAPSRSYLKAIQVSRCVSHIHSGPVSDLSKLQNSCLTSIQVPPSLHPSPYIHISPPSRC